MEISPRARTAVVFVFRTVSKYRCNVNCARWQVCSRTIPPASGVSRMGRAFPRNPSCGCRHSPSSLKFGMLTREEPEVGGVTGAIEPDAEPDPGAFEVPHRVDTAL